MSFINYVTQIQIDFGALSLLKAECERVGITRPLSLDDYEAHGGFEGLFLVVVEEPVEAWLHHLQRGVPPA